MNIKILSWEEKSCQSCGMPMNKAAGFGTNADGTQNQEYCCYCYKNRAFTADIAMEEMSVSASLI